MDHDAAAKSFTVTAFFHCHVFGIVCSSAYLCVTLPENGTADVRQLWVGSHPLVHSAVIKPRLVVGVDPHTPRSFIALLHVLE